MFYTLEYLFIINEAPHRAFNSSSTSVRNLTDDPIARELRRNSISIDKTTVHDTPSVQPIRDITTVQDHLNQSEMSEWSRDQVSTNHSSPGPPGTPSPSPRRTSSAA